VNEISSEFYILAYTVHQFMYPAVSDVNVHTHLENYVCKYASDNLNSHFENRPSVPSLPPPTDPNNNLHNPGNTS
jgi:hypothetical protein